MKDVERTVVLVVMQPAEQIQRCTGFQRVGIGPWKEHHRWLVFGGALQVEREWFPSLQW